MSSDLRLRPGFHASVDPTRPAIIRPATRETMTFAELEESSIRVARLLDGVGVRPGDHVAVLLPNCIEYLVVAWGILRSGVYLTPINWHLTADEAGYILDDCGASVLFSSAALADLATAVSHGTDRPVHLFSVDRAFGQFNATHDLLAAVGSVARDNELEGALMFYSSGTTGRPKGIMRDLGAAPFGTGTTFEGLTGSLFGFAAPMTYLCPAPLYHAAPLGWSLSAHRFGGTVVLMDQFDALESLRLIDEYKVTHAQYVPTMFIRMLKLTETERSMYDLSSLRMAVHAAAPCPVDVKQAMIDWWGPRIMEYYAGSEGNGFCFIDSTTWLQRRGSVGRCVLGTIHIVDEEGEDLPTGEIGTIYFEGTQPFEYHNDAEKTASAFNANGWSTLGDLGHLDADGYLYLSDRRSHLIISGGVNIYPKEIEDLLALHPLVLDVAVIGVPDPEMGEQVKAVVQLADPADATAETAALLMQFCRDRLAHFKCPRSVDFDQDLPRLPSGKLFKRRLMDRYRAET